LPKSPTATIRRNSHVRVVRDKEVLWKGPSLPLNASKEDVREATKRPRVAASFSKGSPASEEGDILQAFDVTYLTQEL